MLFSLSIYCRAPRRAAGLGILAILALFCNRALSAEGVAFVSDNPANEARLVDRAQIPRDGGLEEKGTATAPDFGLDWLVPKPAPDHWWTIDYRFRTLCDSKTSYEFGVPETYTDAWTPLSRLNFSLNSCWHGLDVGLCGREWAVRVEWLLPIERGIQGDLSDYDWRLPGEPFTDLGFMQQKWIDGQMLDFDVEFKVAEGESGIPIEAWLTFGLRWQRFDIMAYDLTQVKYEDEWLHPPYTYQGDVISFNQQYYIGYFGCQFHSTFDAFGGRIFHTMLQADWGFAAGYNVDHHLIREGDRFTMENTHGNSWRLAYLVEWLANDRLSLGFQADFTEICTRGSHRLLNQPLDTDETWYNGVLVRSQQTGLTAFARLRF